MSSGTDAGGRGRRFWQSARWPATVTDRVDTDYQPPLTFNGRIDGITLDIQRPTRSPEDIRMREQAATAQGNNG